MTTETLLHLAERCEKAESPSRELDGWICALVKRGERYLVGHEAGPFPRQPIYGERLDVMREMTADAKGAADYIGAPQYTASLDAAMTLVPDGGWQWTLDNYMGSSDAPCVCSMGDPLLNMHGEAITPALAVCAAALRALAAQAGVTEGGDSTKIEAPVSEAN